MCHSSRPSTNKEVLVNAVDREAVKGVEHEIEFEPGTKPTYIPVRHVSHTKEMEALTKQAKELKQQPMVCSCFVGAQKGWVNENDN